LSLFISANRRRQRQERSRMSYESSEMGALTSVHGMGNGGVFGTGLAAVITSAALGSLAAVMTSPKDVRKKVAIWGGIGGVATYYVAGPVLSSLGILDVLRPFAPLLAGWGVSKLEKAGKLPSVSRAT
jgi:hypothetical protein